MSSHKGLEWTFDTQPALYEKMRPGYVQELYNDIFNLIPISSNSRVLEVGIGAGQATLPILKKDCMLTAVEYGENLANLCREKFKDFPKFSAAVGKFEDIPLEKNTYDLVFSATAFHWIPEQEGYTKVYDILKPNGVFARFANHPYKDKSRKGLPEAIQKIYDVYMPGNKKPKEYGEEEASALAELPKKYGFAYSTYKLYHRTRTFTSQEYIQLLGTYSDHIAIEEGTRRKFFGEIKDAIDSFGGEITVFDTIDLELARKE